MLEIEKWQFDELSQGKEAFPHLEEGVYHFSWEEFEHKAHVAVLLQSNSHRTGPIRIQAGSDMSKIRKAIELDILEFKKSLPSPR